MSNLAEPIERINYELVSMFGVELLAGSLPKFRVVWSDDQFEKRIMTHTNEGFQLISPEVRLVPKYSHYIRHRYILERLVPVSGETDLVTKVSYEPAWVFEDAKGEYLPPRFDACQFIIESLYSQISKAGHFKKYKDPDISDEEREKKIQEMQNYLFGNETNITDALAYKDGIVVPRNFETTPVKSTGNGEGK